MQYPSGARSSAAATDLAAHERDGVENIVTRVLIATDHYPPLIGGAQIQSHMLARELRDRGHEVVVATVWQPGAAVFETLDGIEIHRLRELRSLSLFRPSGVQHHPPYPDPVTAVALRRLIKSVEPDVVDSYGWISFSLAAALVGLDLPVVVTARDYAPSCTIRTLLFEGRPCSGPGVFKCVGCAGRNYGRGRGTAAALGVLASAPFLRRRVTGLRSISSYVEGVMRRDFLAGRERAGQTVTRVVPDMTETASVTNTPADEARARLAELPDEPFLLFVGALRRVKGVEQLLAAYERLSDAPPLVLIGTLEPDSPRFPPIVQVVVDLPHATVMAAWDRCLFGVLPSLWPEPFGTVVTEAMSRGKAVIGTRPGGHTDLVADGETGILVDAGDVDALTEAMDRLIRDANLRERMGQAALIRSRRFTPDAVMPEIEAMYALAQAGAALEPGAQGGGGATGGRPGRVPR
jgi:glycosyltransferase involved in cell wall biosynthesis